MTPKSPDPSEKGINWESREVAERWSRNQARRDKHIAAATEMMLDLACIESGHRVLDVGAGTGGQTLLTAQRVGPSGYVLATDASGTMLDLCAEAVRTAGLTNVGTRVTQAEDLDVEADSFDAVICRTALMLFSDPARAVNRIRRAMRPGAKLSALVFSTPEKNPYQGIPLTIASSFGGGGPSIFALGERLLLENAFRSGGFSDITIHAVSSRRYFSSAVDALQNLREAMFLREAMANLNNADREQAWAKIAQRFEPLERPDGLELPGEMLIAVGTK
jgi:ubiquinone/menaquinone biosynthesis C-methylase UbiE